MLLALVFADPLPLASLRRNVPLPPRLARAIDTAVGERLHGPVLLSRSGQRLDRPETPPESCAGWPAGAGIVKRISPHSLRHSFITTALDARVPLRDVQIAARHADRRTTTRYDQGRNNLDRHASYVVTAFVAGPS
ncbi:MAG: tyrosine-type recombinase/integrase [Actinomycetota bacterium]|nr:tyrosine-type recombinase/integrase [Actinomycetota bacterium]